MKIKIVALGKIKEKYLKLGIDEYVKRLLPYCSLEILELNPIEIKDDNLTSKILLQEGEKVLSCIKPQDFVITLEIQGRQFSSEDFSHELEKITNSGVGEIVFVIGSSCGLGQNVQDRSDLKLSLSKMTFVHQFTRLLLLEQIYRAFKIIHREKYHK